jgi:hypothetical protein
VHLPEDGGGEIGAPDRGAKFEDDVAEGTNFFADEGALAAGIEDSAGIIGASLHHGVEVFVGDGFAPALSGGARTCLIAPLHCSNSFKVSTDRAGADWRASLRRRRPRCR